MYRVQSWIKPLLYLRAYLWSLRWHSSLSAKVNKTQTWVTVMTRVSPSFRVGGSFRAISLANFELGFSSWLINCHSTDASIWHAVCTKNTLLRYWSLYNTGSHKRSLVPPVSVNFAAGSCQQVHITQSCEFISPGPVSLYHLVLWLYQPVPWLYHRVLWVYIIRSCEFISLTPMTTSPGPMSLYHPVLWVYHPVLWVYTTWSYELYHPVIWVHITRSYDYITWSYEFIATTQSYVYITRSYEFISPGPMSLYHLVLWVYITRSCKLVSPGP